MKTAKATLRKQIYKQLSKKSKLSIENDSKDIVDKIKKLEKFNMASHVVLYTPTPSEVNIRDLFSISFKKKQKCYIPVVISKEEMKMVEVESMNDLNSFQPNQWNIPEPDKETLYLREDLFDSAPKSIFVVSPGLGFDNQNNRIGKGGGYYDRFYQKLKKYCNDVFVVGVCFDEQLVDDIPMEKNDQKMDLVITP
eukprot:gene12042-5438_t